MKRAIVFAPLFFLLLSWNHPTTLNKKQRVKTKKTILLDYVIEKSPVLVPANTKDSTTTRHTERQMVMDTAVRKFMFLYNNYGQLYTVKSYNLEGDKQSNPFQISMTVGEQKKLKTINLQTKADKLELLHKGNLLHQIAHFDSEFNELVINTFTYNEKRLPKRTQLGSIDNLSELIDVSFIYDEKQNVIQMVYPYGDSISYAYDAKPYYFDTQPYYYNPFYYLAVDWLIFTNYTPKNNIVKVEDNESIITINYVYNENNLPIKAEVIRTNKANSKDISILNEYEFYYKEIIVSLRD
ncbi:MAG: hypothetical protein LBE34_14650 [Flavobacteriaceae bacterium]|jgi:hypothetical protein|nr:hypothetical protein [Flavobacteriaceae bacterium]